MNFAQWLQHELNKRGWSQGDLVNHIKAAGYKVSRSQISYILNGSREPTGEVCVAIAQGLSLPREKVFRARGWLLYESKELDFKLSPETALVAHEIDQLPPALRRAILLGTQATVNALREQVEE